MKKLLVVLMAIVIALQVSIPVSFASVDDELSTIRSSIRSIQDIDEAKYSKLEDILFRKFPDAQKGAWYISVMTKLMGLSSIDGTDKGTLDPSGTVTRAMFIKMFIRAMYNPEILIDYEPDFDHWAARDVKKAEEIGILAAREYTLDNISEPITRGEMAKLIVRAYNNFEKNRLSSEDCQKFISKIKDYDQIPDFIKPHVLIAYGSGIISGYDDGRFGPNDYATRAQAAAFIIRYLDPGERAKVEDDKKEEPGTTREPTTLRWDDPYRPLPIEGDTFIKPDGTKVVLRIGPAGVLGENQNCDLYGGMAYPDGSLVENGTLGTMSLGHLGETYLVDDYGEGHFWTEWKEIRKYYGRKAQEEVKNPKDGQTYGKWFEYYNGQWYWTGPTNQ